MVNAALADILDLASAIFVMKRALLQVPVLHVQIFLKLKMM